MQQQRCKSNAQNLDSLQSTFREKQKSNLDSFTHQLHQNFNRQQRLADQLAKQVRTEENA